MKRHIVFFIVLLFILFFGYKKKAEWNEFKWLDYAIKDQHYDKAGIIVPVEFKGEDEQYYLQLDTGALSVLYGNSFKEMKINHKIIETGLSQEPSMVSIDGYIANHEFKDKNFTILHEYGYSLEELGNNEYKLVGSLGIDFFENKILILDFPNERFIIAENYKNVPKFIQKNSSYIDIIYKNNKLYLDIEIGNTSLNLFYDSGSSIFPIVTTRRIGLDLIDKETIEEYKLVEIPSWGKIKQLEGARAKGNLKIGELTMDPPLVFYEKADLESFEFEVIQADGLLGNEVFYENYIITLDLINNKFGILKTGS